MLKRFAFTLLLLSVLYCGHASGEINLALRKSCTFTPKPNYRLCTDERDKIQLTDGLTFGCWWVKKTTVGWDRASTGIEIVVDLEQLWPVDEVRVHSVGGGFAYMEFPDFIAVLVSTDGRKYGFAGLVSSEELANVRSVGHKRVPHTFVIDNLNTKARFVKIVVRPYSANSRFFVDEIEVIRKEQKSDKRTVWRENLLGFGDSEALLVAIEDYLQLRENVSETIRVLKNVRHKFSDGLLAKLVTDLDSLTGKFNLPTNEIYSQNELLRLRKKLGAIRAQIYRELYKKPFVCFAVDPMEMLLEKDMQLMDVPKEQRIDIQLWQGEYESAAVNIINSSQEPLDVVVSVSPLAGPGGVLVDSSQTFTVRRAVFVKAIGLGLTADALVLQPEKPFELQPGSVAQVWLTVFNPGLPAGVYKGALAVAASSSEKKFPVATVDIVLKVQNVTFPEEVALNTCTWDEYTPFKSITKHVLPIVAEDLRSHHTNISVIHPYLIPFLKKKSMTKYSSRFDGHLQINNFARMYLLYLEWTSERKDMGRFGEWMSPSWKREFSAWVRMLVNHLQEIGIGYDQFALYPFDESLCDEFYQLAKLVKKTDPKIKIFANSFGKGPKDFMRFKDLIDIWCPHWVHCKAHPEWLSRIKSFDKEIWTYGGEAKGPAKTKPPYGYYRLMAWDAFHRGQTGVGFWIYLDMRNHHPWDDTLKPSGYYEVIYGVGESPVETHGEKIIPSRRWEAWREGIEDYEYLAQLQKAIDQVRLFDPKAAASAQTSLNSQLERVTNNRTDSRIVYSARNIITKTLLQLRQSISQHKQTAK
jgi:hypothetical protein